MPRRGENIYRRKDKRWEARIPKGKDLNGKTLYHSVYGHSYKEVKRKRELLLAEKQIPAVRKDETIKKSFAQALELWMACNQVRLKEQTFQRYQHCAEKHILPVLGTCLLEELDAVIVNQFLQQKLDRGRLDGKGGLSCNYVRLMATLIHSVIKFAVSEGFCQPMKGQVYKPRQEKKKVMVFRKEEQNKLEEALGEAVSGANLAIYLSLHTGLRIGEVCALRWQDIDFRERILHVNSSVVRINQVGKTILKISTPKSITSKRIIPMGDQLTELLKREWERTNSEFVVSEKKKDIFINPRTLENRYKAILKKCNLDIVPYHTLRHTFATRCIESGMDVKSLSELLGHSSAKVTLDIYVHPSIELKRNGMMQLENFSRQNSGQKSEKSIDK